MFVRFELLRGNICLVVDEIDRSIGICSMIDFCNCLVNDIHHDLGDDYIYFEVDKNKLTSVCVKYSKDSSERKTK